MRRILSGYLLNVAYVLAIVIALPWIIWAMLFRSKYREGYAQKLFGCAPRRDSDGTCVWLHAVSVGEVNVLRTLVASIEDRWPDARLCISSTTKTGYDLARQRYSRHTVFYCPLDFTWAVQRAMRRIRPNLLILAELELWPNLVRAAKRTGASVAIVNGRLSEKSFRGYRRMRPLVAAVLREIDVIAAQNDSTAERFVALGAAAQQVHVTGSMKYDGAQTDRNNPATEGLRRLALIAEDDIVFLAGSTQSPEEQLALEAYQSLVKEFPRLRLIVVPRHPQRFDEVARLLAASGLPFVRRSQLAGRPSPADVACRASGQAGTPDLPVAQEASKPLLLVDTVGELAAWWGLARIAFVGGSLTSRGGQNMIEPAAYAAAVCFGPNTRNFRDIVQALSQADAARVVADGNELTSFVRHCLKDSTWRTNMGHRAQAVVRSQLGATERTIALLAAHVAPRNERGNAFEGSSPIPLCRPAA